MDTPSTQSERAPAGGRARRLDEAEVELHALRQHIATLRSDLEDVRRSRSWRLTAPLRRVVAWLSGHRGPEPVPAVNPESGAHARESFLPPAVRVGSDASAAQSPNATCTRMDLRGCLDAVDPTDTSAEPAEPTVRWVYAGSRADAPVVGFIGSAGFRDRLVHEARVVDLTPDDDVERLAGLGLALVIIEPTLRTSSAPWRHGLVDGDRRQSRLVAMVGALRDRKIPVVAWFFDDPEVLHLHGWLVREARLVCAGSAELAAAIAALDAATPVVELPAFIQPTVDNPLVDASWSKIREQLASRALVDGWWDAATGRTDPERLRYLAGHGAVLVESYYAFANVRLDDAPDLVDMTGGCLDQTNRRAASRLFGGEVFMDGGLAGKGERGWGLLAASAGGMLAWDVGGTVAPVSGLASVFSGDEAGGEFLAALSDPMERARRSHLSWRALNSAHTLAHRLQRIAAEVGVEGFDRPAPPTIAGLLVTMRPDLLPACIERFRADRYPERELVVVLHQDAPDLSAARRLVREGERISIYSLPSRYSLGACLNFAVGRTDAPWWTKFDDDDLYGPEYLSDVMLHLATGRFDVFGKPPAFGYLDGVDELYYDEAWGRYANTVHASGSAKSALVAGGTLGGRREVLTTVPFSETRRGGSDSDFIRRCYAAGYSVLSMDGFNFVRYRSEQPGFHTWNYDPGELRQRGSKLGGAEAIKSAAFL